MQLHGIESDIKRFLLFDNAIRSFNQNAISSQLLISSVRLDITVTKHYSSTGRCFELIYGSIPVFSVTPSRINSTCSYTNKIFRNSEKDQFEHLQEINIDEDVVYSANDTSKNVEPRENNGKDFSRVCFFINQVYFSKGTPILFCHT